MSGTVTPFLDFKSSTDSGQNNASSIAPVQNGEMADQTAFQRPSENLRSRTEAIRSFANDTLYLQNADRALVITGPGRVTWPGSVTAGQSGIAVLTDVLWILPLLSPGANQAQPIPPVASTFGVIHLKRSSDNANSIRVTSGRRAYAAGDQINIEVSAGASFSCVLQTEVTGAFRRTIKVVATASTTLGTVITALNGLVPPSPDNTQLVTAALEGGASNADIILDTQARQYMAGNYDGEGHAITPANLASFFTSNPTSALAEGDTLCVAFAMINDTASTGGRRQATPENSNTTVPAGSFFNSRVNPEKLVNALPICKVVGGSLVFGTGSEIAANSTGAPLAPGSAANIPYGGGVPWADGTTNPATSVEAQLDKIITDLVGGTGTSKIQGAVVGSDLAAGTLGAQIIALVNGWLKLDRASTVTGANVFNALQKINGASDTTFALGTDTPPNIGTGRPKPIWYAVLDAVAGIQLRLYTGPHVKPGSTMLAGFMLTINAAVTGMSGNLVTYARDSATWNDSSAANGIRLLVNQTGISLESKASSATWDDSAWSYLFHSNTGSGSSIAGPLVTTDIDLTGGLGEIFMYGSNTYPALEFNNIRAAGTVSTTTGLPGVTLSASADVYFPLPPPVPGANTFYGCSARLSAAAAAATFQVFKAPAGGGAFVALPTVLPQTSSNTSGVIPVYILSEYAAATGETFWLRVTTPGGGGCTLQWYIAGMANKP